MASIAIERHLRVRMLDGVHLLPNLSGPQLTGGIP